MKELKEFLLPFAQLKTGKHRFEFQIEDSFFENYPESEVKQGAVVVLIDLSKQENLLQLDFDIEGFLQVICDRCLDTFSFPIKTTERLLVKFGTEYKEVSDGMIEIPYGETAINLMQHLYEYIMLALPMQRIHPDTASGISGCNPEVFKYLNTEDKRSKIDPRWNILLNINKK